MPMTDSETIPERMAAVLLTGHGGLDKLVYREDVPVPRPEAGEVLIRVAAAGVNNTDINTRIGWYNRAVTGGTTAEGGQEGMGVEADGMGAWTGDMTFPGIQGADAVGRIVAVGAEVDPGRVGQRVVVQPSFCDPDDPDSLENPSYFGAETGGAFAQFTTVPARYAHRVDPAITLDDPALATLPCSGGTAMNMLLLAGVGAGDELLVTGASGGVGSFLVQIGKYLGARVIAVAGAGKAEAVRALGADTVIARETADLEAAVRAATGGKGVTVAADVVGGDGFPTLLSLLRRGGRYVTAGAIAGPMVELDLRTLYLKNLVFYGSTVFRRDTFPRLLQAVKEGAVTPAVARTYPLREIRAAQSAFLEKRHVGSLVLLPPL